METKEEFMKFIKFNLWGNQYVSFSFSNFYLLYDTNIKFIKIYSLQM